MTEKSRRQTGDKRRISNVESFDIAPFGFAQDRQDKLSNKEHRSEGAPGTKRKRHKPQVQGKRHKEELSANHWRGRT